jgi:hypothetical protein
VRKRDFLTSDSVSARKAFPDAASRCSTNTSRLVRPSRATVRVTVSFCQEVVSFAAAL